MFMPSSPNIHVSNHAHSWDGYGVEWAAEWICHRSTPKEAPEEVVMIAFWYCSGWRLCGGEVAKQEQCTTDQERGFHHSCNIVPQASIDEGTFWLYAIFNMTQIE